MSRETLHHLNTSTLIGNTDARGKAWRCRAEEQGEPIACGAGAPPAPWSIGTAGS